MKQLTSIITIGSYLIDFVTEVEVVSSWENLTDTAKITIPERVSWEGKTVYAGVNSIFKPKDNINIKLGYDYSNNQVFAGKLSKMKLDTPIVIDCVDNMQVLKETSIARYSEKNVTLRKLMADISPIPYEVQDINLGKFRITNATVAQVIAEIKKDYGLQAFIRDEKLYVGTPYMLLAKNAKTHSFDLQNNVASSDNLEYLRYDEIKIKVKAISMNADNTKIEVEIGDVDGELRTLNYQEKSATELKKLAEIDMEKLKYEGFRGSFTAFGEPFVRFGDRVKLTDNKYLDRKGTYLVKSVTYRFGMGGYRQDIELERRL